MKSCSPRAAFPVQKNREAMTGLNYTIAIFGLDNLPPLTHSDIFVQRQSFPGMHVANVTRVTAHVHTNYRHRLQSLLIQMIRDDKWRGLCVCVCVCVCNMYVCMYVCMYITFTVSVATANEHCSLLVCIGVCVCVMQYQVPMTLLLIQTRESGAWAPWTGTAEMRTASGKTLSLSLSVVVKTHHCTYNYTMWGDHKLKLGVRSKHTTNVLHTYLA